MGTGRLIPAVFGKQRRDKPLVKPYEDYQRKGDDLVSCRFQNIAKIA
jgi:hypothetical protein